MAELVWIFGSVLAISLLSLVGLITLSLKGKLLNKIVYYLVGFAAGALLGGAFIHLLPETAERGFGLEASLAVLAGIVLFFLIEKLIHWHHCHNSEEACEHTFTHMVLIGDAVHNVLDGIIIAGAYIASIPLGIATTIAVALHEIPQEIGDFGVLVHGGFSKKKALAFNFLTAATAFIGAGIAIWLSGYISGLETFLLPFAAGGFIYIAASDLFPELRKETTLKKSILQLIVFFAGLGIMFLLA
jgi:zinc and cadmium transporter